MEDFVIDKVVPAFLTVGAFCAAVMMLRVTWLILFGQF